MGKGVELFLEKYRDEIIVLSGGNGEGRVEVSCQNGALLQVGIYACA